MTSRERELIGVIGEGLSKKEIAGRPTQRDAYRKESRSERDGELVLQTRLQIAAYAHRQDD